MNNPKSKIQNPKSQLGFSLLELMIVLFIIVILATIALPQYQKTVQQARETVLKDDLYQMRRMLSQYAADKGKLPTSLDDLVKDSYLKELPVDPITNKNEWDAISGDDPNLTKGERGVVDVKSLSNDESLDGKHYNEF